MKLAEGLYKNNVHGCTDFPFQLKSVKKRLVRNGIACVGVWSLWQIIFKFAQHEYDTISAVIDVQAATAGRPLHPICIGYGVYEAQ